MAERREKPQEEHRMAPRVPHPFMIRYRLLAVGSEDWMVSPLRDLSGGGARFLSERPFAVGSLLETQLRLPASRDPILLRARVTWAKPWRSKIADIGVTFEVDDSRKRDAINDAVVRLLQRRPGRDGR